MIPTGGALQTLSLIHIFVRIPAISAQSEHKADMQRAAEYLRDHLLSLGRCV